MGKEPTRNYRDFRENALSILRTYGPIIALGILFLVIQWPLIKSWWKIWNAPYSYFSHGPLVPFIASYMVWANRKRLKLHDIKSWPWGYVLLVISGILFVMGNWTLAATLRSLVFIMMIFAAMLVLLGTRVTRILVPPICFLLTMIPIAPTLLDSATGKLQILSANVASHFLNLSGYSATLQGATIYADGLPEPLIVGIPCSGLRTLISLITFTVFFVYLLRAPKWKKAVLLVTSFPLSVFINSLRIAMIGYVGIFTDSATAMHKFHDYSGYIGLLICFTMLFGLAKLLKTASFGVLEAEDNSTLPAPSPQKMVGGGIPGVVVMLVFILAGLSNIQNSPIYPQTKGHISRSAIPTSFGVWDSEDVPIEKMVLDLLNNGDLLSRIYTDNSDYGRQVHVFMTAARNPDAFHDPHLCLPGGGSPISKDRIITMHFTKPSRLTVKATLLETTNDYGQGLVIYWYMMGPNSMSRTNDVWSRNRDNLLQDLGHLLIKPLDKHKIKQEVESRQFVWYRFSTNVVSDEATDIKNLKHFIKEFVANTRGFGL